MQRLQKVIAAAGLASRRAAEEMIQSGRVRVNGVVAHVGQKVDLGVDTVTVDGREIRLPDAHTYYLVNKPAGVVSTAQDTHGRRTVVDLVPEKPRVVPVGRLDADTTGMMLLTDDGDLTLRLTHPRYGVPKRYRATVRGRITSEDCDRLVAGVELDDGPARAESARIIDFDAASTTLALVLTEGRKREVKRMLDAIGHPVLALHRTSIGPLHDPNLPEGHWRLVTDEEVARLYAAGADAQSD